MTRAELRALLDKATPGPWRVSDDTNVSGRRGSGVILRAVEQFMNRQRRVANAQLAVAARNELPALLDELAAHDKSIEIMWNVVQTVGAARDTAEIEREIAVASLRAKEAELAAMNADAIMVLHQMDAKDAMISEMREALVSALWEASTTWADVANNSEPAEVNVAARLSKQVSDKVARIVRPILDKAEALK